MRENLLSYQPILDLVFDGVYCTDLERRITYWSPAAERITGFKSEEVVGRCCRDNILQHVDGHGKALCNSACPLSRTMRDGNTREDHVFFHHKEGYRVPVRVRCCPLRDANGAIVGALEVFSDVSVMEDLKSKVEELERLAYLDALTQLANRRYTEITLGQRLEEKDRYGWPFGVFIADIDNFKSVNDNYGHDVGDRVIGMVARTLAVNTRPFDLVGRWGGEELVGIVRHVETEKLEEMATRLCRLVENSFLELPDGRNLSVTVSIGATCAQNNDSSETIIKRADLQLYRSKSAGKNRCSIDKDVIEAAFPILSLHSERRQ